MRTFLALVRESCSAGVWSRGVELTRQDAVSGVSDDGNEVTLSVATQSGMITLTVTLYLEDREWECSCSGVEFPCEHIAAATISLNQARKAGDALPTLNAKTGTLRYLLSRGRPGLSIEREIVHSDEIHVLESTLDAIANGRVTGPRFNASQADLAVELALGVRRRGSVPPGVLPRLFVALEGCPDVTLDGEPVAVSRDPVLPRCHLLDAPGGFRLFLASGPRVEENLGNGVVLCDGTLRLRGESRLNGRELQDLTRGQFYSHGQVGELLTEVLPELARRIQIEIETDKLPRTNDSEKPRIAIEVERRGELLSVLPLLVYGEPPIARVDADTLIHLSGEIPVRDKPGESRQVNLLRERLELVPGRRVDFRGAAAVEFADRLVLWKGGVEGKAHRDFYQVPDLEPTLEIFDDRIELQFHSPIAHPSDGDPDGLSPDAGGPDSAPPQLASTEAVLRAWQAGRSMVPLENGGFAELPEDWLTRYGDRVADLLAAQADNGALPMSAIPTLGRLCEELDHPPPPALERLRPLLEGFEGIPEVDLPKDFRGELRSYQQHGVDWLSFLRESRLGALLADDMGLGKTVQALCSVNGRCLVVCPTSVLYNWCEEIERFRPGLSFHTYHGPNRELDESAEVVMTSYAILRLDIERLAAIDWDIVVLDEAQNIKNPDSQVAQAAYRLSANFRVALTGTPVENRLDELWSQFHFLNRGLLGGRTQFRDRYARPIAAGDPGAASTLRERIRPFLLRRKKSDVAPELPPRTDVVLHCELSDDERSVYDAVRAATVTEVVVQLRAGGNVLAALEALLRLRQAACHSSLVPGQKSNRSSKLELLLSRLDEAVADGHKALVFSQWTSLLDLVEPELGSAEIPYTRLDGSTRDRGAVVREFQAEDGPPVMLVSLRAGGTGLNLAAADHIFLLDPWWNPAVEDQAAGRAHRIGQTRPVVVHRLVARNTVEEGILELHERKRALSEAALGSGDGGQGLTREDLLALLD